VHTPHKQAEIGTALLQPVDDAGSDVCVAGLLARVPLVCGPVVQHAAAADGPAVKVRVGV